MKFYSKISWDWRWLAGLGVFAAFAGLMDSTVANRLMFGLGGFVIIGADVLFVWLKPVVVITADVLKVRRDRRSFYSYKKWNLKDLVSVSVEDGWIDIRDAEAATELPLGKLRPTQQASFDQAIAALLDHPQR